MKIEKLYEASMKNAEKFKEMADLVVQTYCTDIEGAALSPESAEGIAKASAVDMAIGAEVVKPKYVIAGVVIGVVTTVATIAIVKKIRKIRQKETVLDISPECPYEVENSDTETDEE